MKEKKEIRAIKELNDLERKTRAMRQQQQQRGGHLQADGTLTSWMTSSHDVTTSLRDPSDVQ